MAQDTVRHVIGHHKFPIPEYLDDQCRVCGLRSSGMWPLKMAEPDLLVVTGVSMSQGQVLYID